MDGACLSFPTNHLHELDYCAMFEDGREQILGLGRTLARYDLESLA